GASAAAVLLDGLPGRDGFVYHDGHNRSVHQAAPGLLGLLESRNVIERWKPQIVRWLDGTEHFFNHLCAEFEGEPAFEPVRREIEAVLTLDAPLAVKNQFLFQYLNAATRELERSALTDAPTLHLDGEQSLAGPWKAHLRQSEGHYIDREIDVPVNWELVPGIENYAGTMRFTRVVTVDEGLRAWRLFLCLHGVDYFADLWVNGHYGGGHEGYYEPFELDISPYVRPRQTNIIRLTVTSPNEPSGPGTHVTSGWDDFAPGSSFPNRKTLVKGTLGHHDAKRGGAWSSLTSQDGNTGGVWDDIELRVLNPVHFTSDGLRVTTLSIAGDEQVAVHLATTIRNTRDTLVDGVLRVTVEPANFEGGSHELTRELTIRPGTNQFTLVEQVAPVRPWWPRDHGFPHLYRITATLEGHDLTAVETGFRKLAISAIGESEGENGAFVVNGREIFVRGTNLLPTYWLSEYDAERVERDFEMLTAGGFNAVLIHNLVLPMRFYEEANRRGFMVVQMFPLQWTYEQSGEFWTRACHQIQAMAARLYNEPSVVSYEVHNEPDMRTFEDLDNRLMDFDLHAALRDADATRWATTFSSGNHAYPGQFYPLRDDNAFATLPARFLEEEYNGRRISRHRNMPTEFGIQAMPNAELLREILAETRVRSVLERIRTDPKWLATGAEGWHEAEKTIEEAKSVLGDGDWTTALGSFDWAVMWDIGALVDRVRELNDVAHDGDPTLSRELLALKLAVLVLEVLHYGSFKGENFWFGLWRPADTLEDFVASSQTRQYRLHKDAIESYLNAGAAGPIVGYFSFMFRDADWQAPTWGVVDAEWVPKKAYRAYIESNHAVRVTLPSALRSPVKLTGDPWVGPEVIVANDTSRPLTDAYVTVWIDGVPFETTFTVDVPAGGAWTGRLADEATEPVVAPDTAPGTYFLNAQIASAEGEVLSTNRYELVVLDTDFFDLSGVSKADVKHLLDGVAHRPGFHYWQGGHVVFRAHGGLRGFVDGFREAQSRGIDHYETIQGEHLFRHVLAELPGLPHADRIIDAVWRIRCEIVSPTEKAGVLLRYIESFVQQAELRLARTRRMTRPRTGRRIPAEGDAAPLGGRMVPVGSDRRLPQEEEA
ncbi:MAG: sugar-binding domain-containing protein, partial [Acidimicrobiales bacterium]